MTIWGHLVYNGVPYFTPNTGFWVAKFWPYSGPKYGVIVKLTHGGPLYSTEVHINLKNGVTAEDFQCSICTDLVTEPIILRPCQHMFCKRCIDGLVGNDMEAIRCPYCQTEFFSPSDLIQPQRIVRQVRVLKNTEPWLAFSVYENANFTYTKTYTRYTVFSKPCVRSCPIFV